MKRIRQALARLGGKSDKSDSDGGSSSASLRKQHSNVDPGIRRSHSRSYYQQGPRAPSTDRLLHQKPLPRPNSAVCPTSTGSSKTSPAVVYDGLSSGDEGVDIVFVHCLGGDRIASWERDGVCWPRDLLPHDIPKCRVIMCGYPTPKESAFDVPPGSRTPGALEVDKLIKEVAGLREGVTRNMILIGHGIGGLVIKEALTTASVDRVYGKGAMGDFYPKTTGIVFLGTPHVSVGRRTMGDVVGAAALLDYPQMSNDLLQLLRADNLALETQRSEFLLVSRDVQVVCVREQVPTSDTQMVPRAVASYEGLNVTTDDVRADHLHIARFEHRQDAGYFQLIGHISKLSRGTPQEEVHSRRIRNREILDALAFDTVGEADERVPETYHETCDWILHAREEGEEESKLQRWLSTPGGSSIFWMSGKPGSGKSTLMKYAFHDPKVRHYLNQWAPGGKLMLAAFYAHEGGNYVQKSREGIMRAVLYQTLTARPELIPICFPSFMSGPWPPATPFNTVVNLSQAFYQFFAHEAKTLRLIIFIDGLDEYRIADQEDHYSDTDRSLHSADTDEDGQVTSKYISDSHKEIAQLIAELGGAEHVKLLVSSREFRQFEESLAGAPRLRVHMQSEKAIARYCADRLDDTSPGLSKSQLSLCLEVARKSKGDILWARIAIDMLMEGSLRQLKSMLDSLPPRLGGTRGLYMRKIENLHPSFQAACCKIFEIILRGQQPLSLITLAFAEDGVYASPDAIKVSPGLGKLNAIHDNLHPHSKTDLQNICERMKQRLETHCAGLLEARADNNGVDTSKRVYFMHQTTKEFACHKDMWDKVLVSRPSKHDIDFSLLSACVRHLRCFGAYSTPVHTCPKPRFEPEVWLLVANALRYAARLEDKHDAVLDLDAYCDLLDELDATVQKTWSAALKSMETMDSDPVWGDGGAAARKRTALARQHWANFEPMESGKSPRRASFLCLALQAGLVRYVASRLDALDKHARCARAQELLEYAVAPGEVATTRKAATDSVSACETLTGNYKDFHRDMPLGSFLPLLLQRGASARAGAGWLRLVRAGASFFSRQSLAALNLATGSSNSMLVVNRQRWAAAVRSMLEAGADPLMEVEADAEGPPDGGDETDAGAVTAIDIIRENLEGEPEFVIDLVQINALVKDRTAAPGQAS